MISGFFSHLRELNRCTSPAHRDMIISVKYPYHARSLMTKGNIVTSFLISVIPTLVDAFRDFVSTKVPSIFISYVK
ncbi:hypothetical protein SAMN05428964_104186 [Thalassospira xiamenensis]|uniref:Uncharacterized protein n=1 Tax=Thalassospira xiamenensis TaxID=220697 RepID=A0A285TMK8_9PROT|nr:hypothetical protein SAMN05428964_104186 [Thalassospira xiamenensis]